MSSDSIRLRAGDASAAIALLGAEPVAWKVGGRDLLWNRDPEHWSYSAPILFPVVGASAGGVVRVGGAEYPMPQHGFARLSGFDLVDGTDSTARLRLAAGPETRAHYPFGFVLDVLITLSPSSLSLLFTVTNAGSELMPYGLGFHPAFPWPLDGPDRTGHTVVFADPEDAAVPEVAPGGLLARTSRTVPLHGGTALPLTPELFSEALVFLNARSRSVRFAAPGGASIGLAIENFPHLAVWSRPSAPFLSLEAWTGHADWEGDNNELSRRASMIGLTPGAVGRHRVVMTFERSPPALRTSTENVLGPVGQFR